MSGSFDRSNRPIMPGAYFEFDAEQPPLIQPNAGSIVAIPFVSDWGPFKQARLLGSFAEYKAAYGTNTTQGLIAVDGAFRGEGIPGRGGAGAVLALRWGGTSAAKATKVLQNTTPATALTLSARYEGTRGNSLKVAVIDNAASSANTDLVLYDNTVEIERYTFADASISGTPTSLVEQINATSQWITAAAGITGVALTLIASPAALAGGNDGAAWTGADFTAIMASLEVERFGLLAFADATPNGDATDGTNLASITTWAKNLNAAGKRFTTVVGGAAAEAIGAANVRSATINDPDFVNLGAGTYTDALYGDLSTSKLAPRVAGILAQRGEVDSITYSRLAGLTIKSNTNAPTESQKLTGFRGGTLTIGRDSNPVAPVRLEKAATTYITTSDPAKPYLIYRNPKFVQTMHGVQMEFTEWTEANIIGQVSVNNKTRDAVRAEIVSRLNSRADAGIIQPKPTVEFDQDPPPSDSDEFLAFVIGMRFGRSAEQVYFTLRQG